MVQLLNSILSIISYRQKTLILTQITKKLQHLIFLLRYQKNKFDVLPWLLKGLELHIQISEMFFHHKKIWNAPCITYLLIQTGFLVYKFNEAPLDLKQDDYFLEKYYVVLEGKLN